MNLIFGMINYGTFGLLNLQWISEFRTENLAFFGIWLGTCTSI